MRAATLTAIAAGSFDAMPSMPIGVVTRASSASSCPASMSCARNLAHFDREPMSPIEPSPGVFRADSTIARSSPWSCVMTSTCAPVGQVGERGLGHGQVLHVHRRHRIGEHGEPFRRREHLGAGVDEVQLELLPAEHASELEADVADAEDHHRRHDPNGFQEHGDLSSAALHAVVGHGLVAERQRQQFGLGGARVEHRAGTVDRGRLEVAAADGAEERVGGDDHLRAAVARRVSAHHREGDDHERHACGAQPLHGVDPVHGEPPAQVSDATSGCDAVRAVAASDSFVSPDARAAAVPARRASRIAMNTASGVAGDRSSTQ